MSNWPREKAPPLSMRGLRKKTFRDPLHRDEGLYEALRQDATKTFPRNQPLHRTVRKAVQAIASLHARDAANPALWEALGRLLSRLEGKDLLRSAAMGCRVVKMMIDTKRRKFVVKHHKVEGAVNVNGVMVIMDFSMSDDPVLNRDRTRVGQFVTFWKKENLKEWGDLKNDNWESTPAGPVFYGSYPGRIGAIGENAIYIFPFESLQQKGYEALDAEDKLCYHPVLPEGADYKQEVGASRPVFTRGWASYQGRMLRTSPPYRVRFEEPIEIIPHARLTEESEVFALDQLPNHLKPGKVEDHQTLISESDQAWYREAGCPKPGMAYVKGEDGVLEVTSHIAAPEPDHSEIEDQPNLMICISEDEFTGPATSPRAENEHTLEGVEDDSAGSQEDGNSGQAVDQNVKSVLSSFNTAADDIPDFARKNYQPNHEAVKATDGTNKARSHEHRDWQSGKQYSVLRPRTKDHRVTKQRRRPKPVDRTGDRKAQGLAGESKREQKWTQGLGFGSGNIHPSRAGLLSDASTNTTTPRTSDRLRYRDIDGSVRSGQTQAATETTFVKQTTSILAKQRLDGGSTRDPRPQRRK